jgi:hypothetical protein
MESQIGLYKTEPIKRRGSWRSLAETGANDRTAATPPPPPTMLVRPNTLINIRY